MTVNLGTQRLESPTDFGSLFNYDKICYRNRQSGGDRGRETSHQCPDEKDDQVTT